MSRFLWLLAGAIGGGLAALVTSAGSKTKTKAKRLPSSKPTSSKPKAGGGAFEIDYEIIDDESDEDSSAKDETVDIEAVVGASHQYGVDRVYETLVREAIRRREKWRKKFTYKELRQPEYDDPDVEDLIDLIEQSKSTDDDIVDRLQDVHRQVYRYHSGPLSSLVELHCPFCRRFSTPSKWYCSYCGKGHFTKHDLPIRRCDCGNKATTLVCKHCYIPIPLLSHTGEIEWDMPAVPKEVTVSEDEETELSGPADKRQTEIEQEQKKKDIERDHRIEEFTSELQTFLEFRRKLESMRAEEEERLADEHGKGSQAYEDGMHQLDAFLQNLERRFREHQRDLIDDTNTETL